MNTRFPPTPHTPSHRDGSEALGQILRDASPRKYNHSVHQSGALPCPAARQTSRDLPPSFANHPPLAPRPFPMPQACFLYLADIHVHVRQRAPTNCNPGPAEHRYQSVRQTYAQKRQSCQHLEARACPRSARNRTARSRPFFAPSQPFDRRD